MKKYITIILSTISFLVALGQTNEVSRPINSIEFTLGGGGAEVNGESNFGLDLSLSTNPFEFSPAIWVGVAQSIYWEPKFGGSTDFYVDWSQDIWDDTIYLNVGWSGGYVYTSGLNYFRTGPELSIQYYTHDNCFVFAGVNWDIWSETGDNEIRYGFGIGILF